MRELERLRAQLATVAAKEVELFKSQLTLDSEVRRLVAAKKVDALLRVVASGEPLMGRLFGGTVAGNSAEVKQRVDAMNEFGHAIREAQPFLINETLKEFRLYGAQLHTEQVKYQRDFDSEAFRRASDSVESFLDLIRRELQVLPATKPTPGL